MSKKQITIPPRVNFYDGQRVSESDLDTEQIHHKTTAARIISDFHGSGIVKSDIFNNNILLDTRSPNLYSDGEINPSKTTIESGNYDGQPIYLDRQPSDVTYGTRVELELIDSAAMGRNKVKVMLLGRAFDGIGNSGEIVAEIIDFDRNCKKVSKHYYLEITSVLFNNFSGGTGASYYSNEDSSLDLISDLGGGIIIREADELSVFASTDFSSQIESPNYAINTFISSDVNNTIVDEIESGFGSNISISDLYLEQESASEKLFEPNGDVSVAYGQKFLAQSDNIQRIDLLMAVSEDSDAEVGSEFDYSGDLVLGIYKLATETKCSADTIPEQLIDFDPEISPLAEVSYSQQDLENLGIYLNDQPQIVSFSFAGTLLADPNIDPTIEEGQFYAFLVARRGDTRTGTVIVHQGYDKVERKTENGQTLTIIEQFSKQSSRYIEFDPNTKRYIDDSSKSLWHVIHADAVEVLYGTAYADDGTIIQIPKVKDFVGDTQISNYIKNIPLASISQGSANYVTLSHIDEFISPNVHPRTGNFVFTRIKDSASVAMVDSDGLSELQELSTPLLLAKVSDKNARDAQTISGTLDKPGLLTTNEVYIIDPTTELLTSNLINRIFVPDTNCQCNARYKIVKAECLEYRAGDFDDDGLYTSSDILSLLDVSGNTINSSTTERLLLDESLSILDFLKGDLNGDDTIDGYDIELLENAVEGSVDFVVSETTRYLKLTLQNINIDSDYPIIFEDSDLSGETTALSNSVTFVTSSSEIATLIRLGDRVEIPADSDDSGTYIVISKSIDDDNLTLTLGLSNLDSSDVEFVGSASFNVIVSSGTATNMYADNNQLATLPFSETEYNILFTEAAFTESAIEICDLRRYVGTSFVEEVQNSCVIINDTCSITECEPLYKNQTYVPGDIYIPNGEILTSRGVPYHGDYEYVNITIPLPPGDITDCTIDLYNQFVKSEGLSGKTVAGYQAMKFSDGTLVGCEDDGADTDIYKGRVKFSHAIAGLYVDALVDGYATSGDSEEQLVAQPEEVISAEFLDTTYIKFDEWLPDAGNDPLFNITADAILNSPAEFEVETITSSGTRYARLNGPTAVQDFDGDFIVDFSASRSLWPSNLLVYGRISSFATFTIVNDDASSAILKVGWVQRSDEVAKIFYSGDIYNSSSALVSSFNYETDAPDDIGDIVKFIFRRVGDVCTAYYYDETSVDLTSNPSGQYIRIGSNPDVQPGSGTTNMSFEIEQYDNPTESLVFMTTLNTAIVRSQLVASVSPSSIPISRDSATTKIESVKLTFPLGLTQRTTLISAIMTLTAVGSISTSDTIVIVPIDTLNADNIGIYSNYPVYSDPSMITTFVPGDVADGGTIEVDVTTVISALMLESGHLPGYIKGFIIEPGAAADCAFEIESVVTLTLTYEDLTTGVIFKVGLSLDQQTGVVTLSTRNVLYDFSNPQNRTTLNFGVHLKKSTFRNADVVIGIADLSRIGVGSCTDEQALIEDEQCYFVTESDTAGTIVEGPIDCITGQ